MQKTNYKKTITFAVTEKEEKLMQEVISKGWTRVEILRRGIVSACDTLGVLIED